MREYKILLRTMLRESIYHFRVRNRFSQERMAEILHISPRSYVEQEHGKYGFSALSLVFYLLSLPEDDVLLFLSRFRANLEKAEQEPDYVA